jgi:hypothetical protein
MSFNYGPNYMSLVEALQQGGTSAAKAMSSARGSRGLATSSLVNRLGDKIDEPQSTSQAILARFEKVKKDNDSLKERMKELGIEQDPVTEELETEAEDVSNLKPQEKPMETAFKLIDDLKSNYDMTTEQAAGFVGNLWHETGGFKFMQELKPTVKGSRGGTAFAMWTGPRRDQFESLLEELGDLPVDSYEGNWAMIAEELDTTERGALNKILDATTVEDAATTTSKFYLRPGKPMLDKRIQDANTIYNAYLESRQGSEE